MQKKRVIGGQKITKTPGISQRKKIFKKGARPGKPQKRADNKTISEEKLNIIEYLCFYDFKCNLYFFFRKKSEIFLSK